MQLIWAPTHSGPCTAGCAGAVVTPLDRPQLFRAEVNKAVIHLDRMAIIVWRIVLYCHVREQQQQ